MMRRAIMALMLAGAPAALMAQMPTASPHIPLKGGPMRAGGMAGGAMLMRADADRDGVVTREEAMAEADAGFDRADADRNGRVTRDEMRAGRSGRSGMRAELRREREAMRTAMRDRANADGARPPSAAAQQDYGPKSGMIREAARARAGAAFDRADSNRDGGIDASEIARLRAMRRAPVTGGSSEPLPHK